MFIGLADRSPSCFPLRPSLPQVFTHPEHQLLVNITARSPRGLLARGLPPDSTLFLRVYASTAKGRSRSVTFEGYTLRMADKQTGERETGWTRKGGETPRA